MRENPRIDLIIKMPGCQVLSVKFLSDKKRVVVSLSNGLILVLFTSIALVSKVLVNKAAVADMLKIIDDKYIICGGIDNQIRIWSIEYEKQVQKINISQYCA